MGSKKKKDKGGKAAEKKNKYPSYVEERIKQAMALEPPEMEKEVKMDNEDRIEKWLRFRPRVKVKFETVKEKARLKNG